MGGWRGAANDPADSSSLYSKEQQKDWGAVWNWVGVLTIYSPSCDFDVRANILITNVIHMTVTL